VWVLVAWLATGPALALAQAPASPAPTQAQTQAQTQTQTQTQAYRTGDAWIDRQVTDIDAYARRYPASFLDEASRHLGVPRGYAEAVLRVPGWRAGDLYFACAWAQATGQSCREVVRALSRAPERDWQAVLEAGPDAAPNLAYRQVRHAIVASYDRWDRPIELDGRLREQLGDAEHRLERARQVLQGPVEPAADR
jgi:hypothetical protein